MGMLEHEDYGPQRRAAEKAIGQTRDFLVDQATDPLNYLGPAGKGLGVGAKVARGLFATTLAGKAEDANAMFFGGKFLEPYVIKGIEADLKAGKITKEELFKTFGYFKNPQGEWRRYVPDNKAAMNSAEYLAKREGTARDFLVHPELYKTNPPIADYSVRREAMPDQVRGHLDLGNKEIVLNEKKSLNMNFSTLLHELQHQIQAQGAVRGGSNTAYLSNEWNTEAALKVQNSLKTLKSLFEQKYNTTFDKVSEIYNNNYEAFKTLPLDQKKDFLSVKRTDLDYWRYSTKAQEQAKYTKYRNVPGEVEARVTQRAAGKNLMTSPTGLTELYDMFGKEITHPQFYDNFQFSFD